MPLDFFRPLDHVEPVPQVHRFDEAKLLEYLRSNVYEHFGKVELSKFKVLKFKFGQSNPTYLLSYSTLADESDTRRYVLRKKPNGKLLSSAHAVEREYRVMSSLQSSRVPVPQCYHLCLDSSVIGTPFYICEFINGRVFKSPELSKKTCHIRSNAERFAMYYDINRVLAAIHSVNLSLHKLTDYGGKKRNNNNNNNNNQLSLEERKKYSYVNRLRNRWNKQFNNSLTAEVDTLEYVPKFFDLINKYEMKDDQSLGESTLIHGDFRIDNLVFHPTKPKVIAVLDWELSTIGNPLTDAATFCLTYHFDAALGKSSSGPSALYGLKGIQVAKVGIPTEFEFLQGYINKCSEHCELFGKIEFPIRDWNYYLGLGVFRYIGIFQGVFHRVKHGNASNPDQSMPYKMVMDYLAATGIDVLERVDIFKAILNDSSKISSIDTSLPAHLEPFREKFSPKFFKLRRKLLYFMEAYVAPAEKVHLRFHSQPKNNWKIDPNLERLKNVAKDLGLWNLFLPREYKESPGLTNLEYAPLCEIMGRSVGLAPEACNCSAPDTGNMEVLAKYGNDYQKEKWLKPLMNGEIRSCFAMTEIDVASSDATNICTNIVKTSDGQEYIINGRKWWTSGAMDPRCKVAILMGRIQHSRFDEYDCGKKQNGKSKALQTYFQQSMMIVPMNLAGVKIVRHLTVFGYDDAPHGHAEVVFENVRVPKENLLLGEGRGFEIAQGRLGPGRIHHCMRLIGMAERSIEVMNRRVLTRFPFKKAIGDQSLILSQLSDSRSEIEQARLLTLQTACMMDLLGNKVARQYISMIKVVAPRMALNVIDRAIQAAGGQGVSQDTELAYLWTGARSLRIADGPDAVHERVVARLELAKAKL